MLEKLVLKSLNQRIIACLKDLWRSRYDPFLSLFNSYFDRWTADSIARSIARSIVQLSARLIAARSIARSIVRSIACIISDIHFFNYKIVGLRIPSYWRARYSLTKTNSSYDVAHPPACLSSVRLQISILERQTNQSFQMKSQRFRTTHSVKPWWACRD